MVGDTVTGDTVAEVAGVPVLGGLADAARVAAATGADTVAVLACPEMDGVTLRRLAGSWRRKARTCAWPRR